VVSSTSSRFQCRKYDCAVAMSSSATPGRTTSVPIMPGAVGGANRAWRVVVSAKPALGLITVVMSAASVWMRTAIS